MMTDYQRQSNELNPVKYVHQYELSSSEGGFNN